LSLAPRQPRAHSRAAEAVIPADHSAAVCVRGLSKAYGQTQAVRELDLDVGYGEIFAILGPNGAGKSTTIEILEGHRHRDSGHVRVLGEDPGTAGRSWRAKIGIVLQEVSDSSMLTVSETVQVFTKCYGKARVPEQTLELVGLTAVSGSRVKTLSGGQRRRLDVALGIIGMPELLFLDEPTTGFDPDARRRFWDLIRLLASDGTTILLTTHYLDEAAALADRVAVLAGGRVVAVDSPARLTEHVNSAATVRWVEGDRVYVEKTDHPTDLIRRRSRDGAELAQLTVSRPTLEDAYLQLIGLT
jgi:ABC-2 type transport system ATP-binding protein